MARMTGRAAALVVTLLAAGVLSASAWAALPKPPNVTLQPQNATVEEGNGAAFEAAASGNPAPTVQWEISTDAGSTWSAVAGANANRLTIASAKTSESGHEYRAVFTNASGSETTRAVTLTVRRAPAITQQPLSSAVEEGQVAVFEAAASGFPTPSVQWETSTDGGASWSQLTRGTTDQLTVASAKISQSGNEFRAVFTNVAGAATTEVVRLIVHNLPRLTKQPVSVSVEAGRAAAFEATATGFPAPTVQWELSSDGGGTWSPVEGATGDRLAIASASAPESGDLYRAVFTNEAGHATSNEVSLTVTDAAAITEQPSGTTVEVGDDAAFEAMASGFPAPTVQWELSSDGGASWSAISGATADRLTLEDVQASQDGDEYRAVFTNTGGSAASEAVMLTVASTHYRVFGWGEDAFGQLGDGALTQSDAPVIAGGLNFVTAVAAGKDHSLALLANGTVMAWGSNASGQLGDGEESVGSDVPVLVQGLTHVKAIAAGANQSLALLEDGTVMAWGGNESGQLGDGNTEESYVPVPVKGLTGATAIAAGGEHSMALLSDGKAMAWGDDEQGQLGDDATANSDVPVSVRGLAEVAAIAAGNEFSLALLSDGGVMAWGTDRFGQLANSGVEAKGEEEEERFSAVAVPVNGVSGVSAIASGARHSLALLANGTVMAWGEDAAGELGDGRIARSEEVPVAVSALTGVTQIAAGGAHSMALLGNGSVMSWGEDRNGELGAGSAGEASDVPVAVVDLTEVRGIAAGGLHELVYGEPIPEVTGLSPALGTAAGGTPVTIAGSDFEGVTSVRFGSTPAASFTVNSPGSITALAPSGALGTVNVTVTTPAGTSTATAADHFTYLPVPTVTKLSAKGGAAAGGSTVTIAGTGFAGATSVSFGANAAVHFTVNSAISITATSPVGSGLVDVKVTTAGGTSAASKHDQWGYTPAVEAVAPANGPVTGGTRVAITGVGFVPGAGTTAFRFASKKATHVECASSTSCTATAPKGRVGTVDVSAAVGKLKSAANPPGDRFTYEQAASATARRCARTARGRCHRRRSLRRR
jgi:alpha-tubulin suppressor-like RCC1 family protein